MLRKDWAGIRIMITTSFAATSLARLFTPAGTTLSLTPVHSYVRNEHELERRRGWPSDFVDGLVGSHGRLWRWQLPVYWARSLSCLRARCFPTRHPK